MNRIGCGMLAAWDDGQRILSRFLVPVFWFSVSIPVIAVPWYDRGTVPDDLQAKPPTLGYQPATESSRRVSIWWAVLLAGFALAAVVMCWPSLDTGIVPKWIAIARYPGELVGDLVAARWHSEWLAEVLACLTVGVECELLAILSYAAYRGRRHYSKLT